MATPQNRNNTALNTGKDGTGGGSKETWTTIRYGNNHGSISFGHISKLADVTGDCLIQAFDGRHQISMDKDGPRKGFTSIVAPTNLQLGCGEDIKKEQDTFMLHAENGNIIINASNGKIEFNANDVQFNVKGKNGKEGNFVVSATENITFKDCKKFQVTASQVWKLATPGKAEAVANTQMKTISKVIRGVTAGCSLKDGKFGDRSKYIQETAI